MNSSLGQPFLLPSVAWMSASMWIMSDEAGPAIPSICTGGSQTAAIRIWFRSTSSPIGYSRKPAGRRVARGGGRSLCRSGTAGVGGRSAGRTAGFVALEIQVEHQDQATPPRIRRTMIGPIQRWSMAGVVLALSRRQWRSGRERVAWSPAPPGGRGLVGRPWDRRGSRGGSRPTTAARRPAAAPGPRRPGGWDRARPAGTRRPARPEAWSAGCRRSGARRRRCRRR